MRDATTRREASRARAILARREKPVVTRLSGEAKGKDPVVILRQVGRSGVRSWVVDESRWRMKERVVKPFVAVMKDVADVIVVERRNGKREVWGNRM
jgi:hypothetical protein